MSSSFTWSSPNNGRQSDDFWDVTFHRSNGLRLRRVWSDARRFRGLGETTARFGKKLAWSSTRPGSAAEKRISRGSDWPGEPACRRFPGWYSSGAEGGWPESRTTTG